MSDSNLRDGSGNPITSTANAIDVNIKSGAGAGGGGTQYADGTTQATPTGTAILGKNPSNVLKTVSLDASNNLNVNLAAGSISGGNAAASPTASAVPASADYTGFNSGGNLVGVSAANPLPTSLASLPALAAGSAVIGHVINDASSAVIGHVITDTGSTTAVTGNVTAVQPTGTNLHVVVDTAPSTPVTNIGTFPTQATLSAETTKVIGTVNVAAAQTIGLAAGAAVIGHVINDASSAVIGHVITDTGSTTAATLAAETTKVIGTVNIAAAQSIAVTQPTAANLNATVVGPTLTKGTQGAAGFSTQDLKDAGRTYITLTADAVTPAASDTVLTFAKNVAGTATGALTTYAITAGKTLRIQAIYLTFIQSSATLVGCRVRLRHNTAGAAIATSSLVGTWQVGSPVATAVANGGFGEVSAIFPDGLEIKQNGTDNITFSAIATSAAGALSVTLVGYEY